MGAKCDKLQHTPPECEKRAPWRSAQLLYIVTLPHARHDQETE